MSTTQSENAQKTHSDIVGEDENLEANREKPVCTCIGRIPRN